MIQRAAGLIIPRNLLFYKETISGKEIFLREIPFKNQEKRHLCISENQSL